MGSPPSRPHRNDLERAVSVIPERPLAGEPVQRPAVERDLAANTAELPPDLDPARHDRNAAHRRPDGRARPGAGARLSPRVAGKGVHHLVPARFEHQTPDAMDTLRP